MNIKAKQYAKWQRTHVESSAHVALLRTGISICFKYLFILSEELSNLPSSPTSSVLIAAELRTMTWATYVTP
jgi:hypothetical protein